MAHEIDGRIFVGGLDTDSDPTVVEQGDYIDAADIINGYAGTVGVVEFPKGTTALAYTLPSGTNYCVGTCEDKFNNRTLFFFWNANDNHTIISWDPITQDVKQLAFGPELGFSSDRKITHSFVVNGQLLYWTDAVTWSGDIQGGYQKVLDLTRAYGEKKHTFELYAGKPGEGQFATGFTYSFYLVNPDTGVETNELPLTADGTFLDDPEGGLAWLATELVNFYENAIIVEECGGCKISIEVQETAKNDKTYIKLVTSDSDVLLVPINCYPINLRYQHLDLLKEPPHCAPTIEFKADPSYVGNNVKDGCFQVICRYIYYNGERSAWSPISNVGINVGADGETIEGLNMLDIDFSDVRLVEPEWLCMIRFVEIAFRKSNVDNFYMIERIPVCEIGIVRQYYEFRNDGTYSAVPSDEAGSSDLQVLKPFDFMPILAGTMAVSADDSGNTIIFQGATQEGYDCPDCADVEFTTEEIDDGTIDIVGRISVVNDPDFSSDTPDYDHYPLNGFVVYLAGTRYYGISDNPAGVAYPTATGIFRIKNVPRGKYILRVASFRCSFGSPLAARYDLNNGLEWQRTSSPIITPSSPGNAFVTNTNPSGVGGVLDGITELTIDTTAFVGTEYNLETEFTPFGVIFIYNQHYSRLDDAPGNDRFDMREIYVLDNDASDADTDTRIGALNCELQEGNITGANPQSPALLIDYNFTTDHNGYVVMVSHAEDTFGNMLLSIVNSTSPGAALYKGDYDKMYADTLTLMGTLDTDGPGVYFWINKDEDFSNKKVTITVETQDANGNPVQGVIVAVQGTTRTIKTPLSGDGQIVCFMRPSDDPAGADKRTEDSVIALYPNDTQYQFYGTNPLLMDLNLTDVIAPFIFGFTFIGGVAYGTRHLKSGGVYKMGILYEDRGNRTCGVMPVGTLEIPYHVGGLLKYDSFWAINHVPPDWATHYRFVRTKNILHKYYVQWGVKSVIYARVPSQVESPIITDFTTGDATHLFFELFVPAAVPLSGAYYLPFYQLDGQWVYVPQPGDRARMIVDENGEPFTTATEYFEAAITGTYVDGDKVYAVVENIFGNREIKAGSLAEYYAVAQSIDEIYYEGGEDCYEITQAGPNRFHAGPIQNQTGSLPATGKLNMGDTWWRNDSYTGVSALATEHQSLHRGQYMACEDIGRAFVYDPDAKQIFFINRVRNSGRYVVSSDVNGLSSYRALDYKDINREWGIINWLGFVNNVLLAVCRYRVQPLYINRDVLSTFNSNTSVVRSDSLIEIADESVTPYGTHNPESVVVHGPYLFAWDKYNGVVWRYATNGVEDIVVKMVKYFRARGLDRIIITGDVVLGGFDRVRQRYFISFVPLEGLSGETLSFDNIKGRWDCKHRFTPDAYAMIGQEMLTARRVGSTHLWRHFNSATYANYHGTQRLPYIQIPFNAAPGMNKIWWSMRVLSSKQFTATQITVPASVDYASGMSSRLKSGRWKSYEGHWWADFLRDMNDTAAEFLAIADLPTRQATALLRGRQLRGEVVVVTLTAVNGAVDTKLRRADVYFSASKVTNS